jgi:hypothetical protein
MEASPGSDNFCSTFFSSSPISRGGDSLSTICLLFIVYLSDIYEFTFFTFYCSNMLLSIAYYAWWRVIIYDDNLSCRSLSQAKRKIYIFLLSFFERKSVATCFVRDLRRVFWMKITPNNLLCVAWNFLGTKNHWLCLRLPLDSGKGERRIHPDRRDSTFAKMSSKWTSKMN